MDVGEESFEQALVRSICELVQDVAVQRTGVLQKEKGEDGDQDDETQVPQRGEDSLPYLPDEREDLIGVAGHFLTDGIHRLGFPGFQRGGQGKSLQRVLRREPRGQPASQLSSLIVDAHAHRCTRGAEQRNHQQVHDGQGEHAGHASRSKSVQQVHQGRQKISQQ